MTLRAIFRAATPLAAVSLACMPPTVARTASGPSNDAVLGGVPLVATTGSLVSTVPKGTRIPVGTLRMGSDAIASDGLGAATTSANGAAQPAAVRLDLLAAGLVCDGATDNKALLNASLAAALSQGEAAHLPATPKPCMSSPGVAVPAGLVFSGDGAGSVLQLMPNSGAAPFLSLGAGARLERLTVDGNVHNNPTASDLVSLTGGNTVDAATIRNARGRCLVATGAGDTVSSSKLAACYGQTRNGPPPPISGSFPRISCAAAAPRTRRRSAVRPTSCSAAARPRGTSTASS